MSVSSEKTTGKKSKNCPTEDEETGTVKTHLKDREEDTSSDGNSFYLYLLQYYLFLQNIFSRYQIKCPPLSNFCLTH